MKFILENQPIPGVQKTNSKEKTIKPESQDFLDPGLAKPQPQLNLVFKNADLGLTLT